VRSGPASAATPWCSNGDDVSEPIAPIVNDLNRPFWAAAKDGRLVLPWRDGGFAWPPAPTLPDGGADWRAAPATGVLIARAIYRRPFQKVFADVMPYGVGEVALDAGPRLRGHLSAPDHADAPEPGDRVRLVFRPVIPGGPPVPHVEREKAA
jgi:uncharacterized OB-fold protein